MLTRHIVYVSLGILMLLSALAFPALGGSSRIILRHGFDIWGPIVVGVVAILGVLLFVKPLPVKGAILLILGLIPAFMGLVAIGLTYPYKVPVGGSLVAMGGALVADAGIGILLTKWLTNRKLRKDAARASLGREC